MVDAHSLFSSIYTPNVVHWNTLLMGYVENGQASVTLELFSRMEDLNCLPSSVTYLTALKACISLVVNGGESKKNGYLKMGREIHFKIGCHSDHYVQGTLVDMYSKCGSMVEAQAVFDAIQNPDVVSWTTLLSGYAENGEGLVALELFTKMKGAGCAPNSVTYVAVLKACTSLAVSGDHNRCWKLGRGIHLEIGHHMDDFVQSTLVDMYSKCGRMIEARSVFDGIHKPDVVSWTALLLGYAENGEGYAVLDLFSRMKKSGCMPDSITYVAAIKACGLIGALASGRRFHSEIREFTTDVVTCLVDFYAKCGSMAEARKVFEVHSSTRDVMAWNALLAGYARFGDSDSVFSLFKQMQGECLRPNDVTFVSLLLCCSHSGLVEKAREFFEAMPVHYGIIPAVIHYTCMVDILGRRNELNEAMGMIRKMPCNPDAVIWRTLLSACRKWKNVKMGREAFQALAEIDKKNASPYVLLASLYEERNNR